MEIPDNLLSSLRQLQDLVDLSGKPLDTVESPNNIDRQIAQLRGRIPTSILGYFDAKHSRGRKAVAPVSHDVCGGCHMHLPTGRIASLRSSKGLNICDHCGVFIYLQESKTTTPAEPARKHVATRAKRSKEPV